MINEELDKAVMGCKSKFSNPVGVAPIGSFSWALMRLKEGAKIQRKGWNGKGMWIAVYEQPPHIPVTVSGYDGNIDVPMLFIKTVKGTLNTWVPSISDLFAEDWEVVE